MTLEEKIKKTKEVLEELNPMLKLDGGFVEFVDYQDDIVFIKLEGHCIECMGQEATLASIQKYITEEVPEVKKVINIPV